MVTVEIRRRRVASIFCRWVKRRRIESTVTVPKQEAHAAWHAVHSNNVRQPIPVEVPHQQSSYEIRYIVRSGGTEGAVAAAKKHYHRASENSRDCQVKMAVSQQIDHDGQPDWSEERIARLLAKSSVAIAEQNNQGIRPPKGGVHGQVKHSIPIEVSNPRGAGNIRKVGVDRLVRSISVTEENDDMLGSDDQNIRDVVAVEVPDGNERWFVGSNQWLRLLEGPVAIAEKEADKIAESICHDDVDVSA